MTRHTLFQSTRQALIDDLPDSAAIEAEIILTTVIPCSRHALLTDRTSLVDAPVISSIQVMINRRLTGEPLAYILGKAWFYGREFNVSSQVLIPRCDTETVIQAILDNEKSPRCFFADLGTGSGCIALTLTYEQPAWRGIGIDQSLNAIGVAATNQNGRIYLVAADLLSACKPARQFDFIVSNPPYIATAIIPALDAGVRDFEPRQALCGGIDGLDFYRTLSTTVPALLKPGGRIYLEIGYDQKKKVTDLLHHDFWQDIVCLKDLGDNDRVIIAQHG